MRFLLSILIWIFFVGGLWMYTLQRDARLPDSPTAVKQVETVSGKYTLEITPTFSIEADPFALQSDTENAGEIELRLNGQTLRPPEGDISRGKVLKIVDITRLAEGFNEFFISASPPISEIDLDHGIRVRLLDGENIIVDDTVWAGNGARVSGTISFQMELNEDHDHDH